MYTIGTNPIEKETESMVEHTLSHQLTTWK